MKANDANTLAASVGCPVGANRVEWLVAEVKRLREQVASLTPRWQEGEPPGDTWVWREGSDRPVWVHLGGAVYVLNDPPHFVMSWGTARWAPIPKPMEG